MDVAGLTFAVAGVAKTWVDLVGLTSTARHISEALDGFITHVESQRVIFWLWIVAVHGPEHGRSRTGERKAGDAVVSRAAGIRL